MSGHFRCSGQNINTRRLISKQLVLVSNLIYQINRAYSDHPNQSINSITNTSAQKNYHHSPIPYAIERKMSIACFCCCASYTFCQQRCDFCKYFKSRFIHILYVCNVPRCFAIFKQGSISSYTR